MAVTCLDLLELDSCRKMKLLAGKEALNRTISWPYIKTIDNLADWLYGDEIVFVLEERAFIQEKELAAYLKEAIKANISAMVLVSDRDHFYEVTPQIKKMAENANLALFSSPFGQRLIDITRDIAGWIVKDQIHSKQIPENEEKTVMEMLLNKRDQEDILFHCYRKLQPLLESDTVNRSELVKTLYSYLHNGNDALRTSEKLFIHRNTMNARMKKIDSLLMTDMNDPETRTEYMNIFRTLEYLRMEVF